MKATLCLLENGEPLLQYTLSLFGKNTNKNSGTLSSSQLSLSHFVGAPNQNLIRPF